MRGSPLIHCLIACLGFALFAIPLARLTEARPETQGRSPAPSAETSASAPRPTLVRIRFAHAPRSLSLKLGDRELLPGAGTPSASPLEAATELVLPAEGLELSLAAAWPEGTPPTAITVELEPDELESRQATAWSDGPGLNRMLSFKW